MEWLQRALQRARPRAAGRSRSCTGSTAASKLEEEVLDHLEGYRGSAPVRIGNGAADQLQLDIYGELIDSVYLYSRTASPIDHDAWVDLAPRRSTGSARTGTRPTRASGRSAAAASTTPTRGSCPGSALERAVRMALERGLPGRPGAAGSRPRDQIYHQIMARGWHEERQAFVQHYDSEFLDAAVLLMPLVNFVAPTDPRWLSTLDAMSRELVSDSLVYRYNVEASPDGLEGEEGTFSICTFWYVEALARAGRRGRGAAGLREDAHLREPPRPLRRGDRPHRRGARQLPPGVHAPGADQRGVRAGPQLGKTPRGARLGAASSACHGADPGDGVARVVAHPQRTRRRRRCPPAPCPPGSPARPSFRSSGRSGSPSCRPRSPPRGSRPPPPSPWGDPPPRSAGPPPSRTSGRAASPSSSTTLETQT